MPTTIAPQASASPASQRVSSPADEGATPASPTPPEEPLQPNLRKRPPSPPPPQRPRQPTPPKRPRPPHPPPMLPPPLRRLPRPPTPPQTFLPQPPTPPQPTFRLPRPPTPPQTFRPRPPPPPQRPHHRRRRAHQRRRDLQVGPPRQHGKERVCAQVAVVQAGVGGGQKRMAGADPGGNEPEEGDRDQARRHRQAEPRVAHPQPGGVQQQQRPHLGAHQPGGHAQQEGHPPATIEMAVERPQPAADQQRLAGSPKHVVAPVLRQRHPECGQTPGQHAPAPRSHQAPGQPPGGKQPEQAAGSGGDHPQRRGGAPEQRVDRGEDHRQRLP